MNEIGRELMASGGLLRQVAVVENNTQDTLIAYRFGGIKEER